MYHTPKLNEICPFTDVYHYNLFFILVAREFRESGTNCRYLLIVPHIQIE